MRGRKSLGLLVLSVVLAGCQSTPTATSTTLPAGQNDNVSKPVATTAPDLGALPGLLANLDSEDYATRANADKALQQWMAAQIRDGLRMQKMLDQTTSQYRALRATRNTEAGNRVAALLEFQQGLLNYVLAANDAPEAVREKLLTYGLSDTGSLLCGRAFHRDPQVRATAAQELGEMTGWEVEWILGRLLQDNEREVVLATIEACWNRKPTKELVDTLWDKGVEARIEMQMGSYDSNRTVMFRGVRINLNDNGYRRQQRAADAEQALALLISWDSPVVKERLELMLKTLAEMAPEQRQNRVRYLITTNYGGDLAKSFLRLTEAYKPKGMIELIISELANINSNDGSTSENNGTKFYYGSRVDLVAAYAEATDQDPEIWGLIKMANWNGRYVLPLNGEIKDVYQEGMKQSDELAKKVLKQYKEKNPKSAATQKTTERTTPQNQRAVIRVEGDIFVPERAQLIINTPAID
jgi:hypothetical protein